MSCPVNTFNKSKEDFIWFVKKAVTDKKSYSHSELYHSLLKLFVDADTNKDGLVSKASFSKLIDAAAAMPRAYGYAPIDSELYKTEAEKDAARQKMFDSMDLKSTGVITFDEWLKFCHEHIAAKTATMDPHPIIDAGSVDQYKNFIKAAVETPTSPEAVELYWYMLEMFTEHDTDKDGIIKMSEFPAMMNEFLTTAKKHSLTTPTEVDYDTLFKKYDPRNDGRLTVDEWMSLAKEEVFKKFL
eukprot:TRINITY_DN5189_c0_g1_i2.p1 TRINITY_DN5189_c0_g1~~TRINITY_DN5189_c0_g1_i2.p1  ORF type:complete len:242 (+),score=99.43 TRINITY_DN5189_c0_g1_i2:59-784(+)